MISERVAFNLRSEYIWLACGLPESKTNPHLSHVDEILREVATLEGPILPADGYVILNAVEVAAIIQYPDDWLMFKQLYRWVVRKQVYPCPERRELARAALHKLYDSPPMRADWHQMITSAYIATWQAVGVEPGFDHTWAWGDILDHIASRL